MLGFVFYVFLVGFIVLFASQNQHVISVYLLLQFNAPLVVVVGVSFFVGFATAIFGVILQAMKRRREQAGPLRPGRGEVGRRGEVAIRPRRH
ncbi:MAG: lipopolysaccharide assembly protein LapA domain-containing protein [Alphaproteobacteria bacterium]